VHPFTDPREGLSYLSSDGADVVLTDLKMPGLSGMEVIGRVAAEHPGVSVVVLTAFGTVYNAVEAMRAGASDFLEKPVGIPQLRAAVFKAVKDRERNREIEQLREEMGQRYGPEGIIAFSRTMEEVIRKIRLVAPTRMNVLIQGESGTGKELVARAIHALSPRRSKPFLPLNCAAIPETLLESELFGYEKGAFTGAVATRQGKLEAAEGGTLFLDEVGDMALSLQAKLLRVIENRKVMRVGGLKPKPIDVRFVSATNRELETDVMRGTFRQDLYFRINGVTLSIPPLRERIDEIPGLAQAFVTEAAEPLGQKPPELSTEAFELLAGYSWPGNIRELRNVMERAVLLCLDDVIRAEHLPVEKMRATFATPVRESAPAIRPGKPPAGERETDEAKRQRILEALMACGGNNTEAAKILGVSRRTLGKWLEAYNIPRPRKKKGKPKAASE
jgi:two-component system response regulator HydG